MADRLVISAPRVDDDADDRTETARRICADPPTGVVCVVPDPSTTRGEVQFVRRLTEEEGWDSLAVVTTGYHATRTGYLFG